MADTQPQGDKARKPRPFGSFLLFLTVIVVVLVAFSGSQLRKQEELTQDAFLHALVTGYFVSLMLMMFASMMADIADHQ